MIGLKTNRYGLVVLAAGALTLVGSGGFARYAFPLLLPDMREGLRASYALMGLVATVNSVGYVISSLAGGALGSRYGPRRVIPAAMFLAGITTFATGLSPGVEFALAMQLLAGLFAGGAIIPAVALAAAWFEPSKRGIASGIIVGGMPLGILASSRLIPPLLTGFGQGGWRYGWMVMGAVVALLGVVALLLVRDRPGEASPGGGAQKPGASLAAPLDWGLAYKNRAIWTLCIANFSTGLAGGIFATFFVAYLVAQGGFTQSQAGDAWGLVGLAGAASGLVLGYIADLINRRIGLAANYYVFFLSLLILAFVTLPGAHYAAALMGGLTLWGGMTVTVALVGDIVGPRLVAAAFGLISLSFNLGQVFSPTLAGAITDATGFFTLSLVAAMVFAFGAASLCLLLPSLRRGQTATSSSF